MVKNTVTRCCCSIKMSPPNCSVKMSPPYGDIHDEQEGSPPGRAGESGLDREDHEPGGSAGLAAECAAVQAAEGALPRGGRAGPVASQPRAGVAASVAARGAPAGGAAVDDPLRGLQRRPPDGKAAGTPRAADQSGQRADRKSTRL